jgi:hypothetical protein
MKHLRRFLLLSAIVLPQSAIAQSLGASPQQPQWWQVVAGVLAIPAAILGIAYSYILIRKTKLDARKTELEILEKERALNALGKTHIETAKEIVRPIIENKKAQVLVLRFALLYVMLSLWGLVESGFGFLMSLAAYGLQQAGESNLDNPWVVVPAYLLAAVPRAVNWIIVIGIGWPLFRDLNAFMNLDLKKTLMPWRK